ncbi:unnamed protein product, partial [Didymodactylos carnosus]
LYKPALDEKSIQNVKFSNERGCSSKLNIDDNDKRSMNTVLNDLKLIVTNKCTNYVCQISMLCEFFVNAIKVVICETQKQNSSTSNIIGSLNSNVSELAQLLKQMNNECSKELSKFKEQKNIMTTTILKDNYSQDLYSIDDGNDDHTLNKYKTNSIHP